MTTLTNSSNTSDITENTPEKELIRRVKRLGDSEAFLEICRRTERLFYKVCQKYSKRLTAAGISCEDIFEEKNVIIFHCVRTFDLRRKTKLSTWIGNYSRYLCLNSINERKMIFPSNDEEVHKAIENAQTDDHDFNLDSLKNYKNYIYNILDQMGDQRMAEVVKLRYFGDKKLIWEEVAKKTNLSVQTCLNLNRKSLNFLRNKLKSKEMMDTI